MGAKAQRDLDRRIQTLCLFILTAIAIGVALHWLRPVLIPFVLAIFFTYTVAPLIDLLIERARAPKWAAILVALALGGGGVFLIGALLTTSVRQLARNATAYQDNFLQMADLAAAWLEEWGLEFGAEAVQRQLEAIPVADLMVLTANTLIDTVSNTFLVIVFGIYLILGYERAAEGQRGSLRNLIESRIKRYIATKFAISAVTGTAVWLILSAIGVDLALVFGMLAFLLNFIPSIGSILATFLPLPVLLVTPGLTTTGIILAIALPGAVQVTIGNFVEPLVMGDSLELHPITILLALILWGMIWGIVGMFLAVPITAVIKILLDNLEMTRPVAHLMAGRLSFQEEGSDGVDVAEAPLR